MPTNDITKLLKFEGINFVSQEEKEGYTLNVIKLVKLK